MNTHKSGERICNALVAFCMFFAVQPALSASIDLSDGQMYAIPQGDLLYAAGEFQLLGDLNFATGWTLNGNGPVTLTLKDGTTHQTSGKPTVRPDGTLLLTADANLKNTAHSKRLFGKADHLKIAFTANAVIPENSVYRQAGNAEVLSNFMSFYLTSAAKDDYSLSGVAAPKGSYGFSLSLSGDRAGVRRLNDGVVDLQPCVPNGSGGVTVDKPIDFEIECLDGQMTVKMTQESHTASFACDVGAVFGDSAEVPVRLGFAGCTEWWGQDESVPWSVQTVADFSCQVREMAGMTQEHARLARLSSGNWTVTGNYILDSANDAALLHKNAENARSVWVHTAAFSPDEAFTLTWKAILSEQRADREDGGFSCAFQTNGTAVAHSGKIYLDGVDSCGFAASYYSKAGTWIRNRAIKFDEQDVIDFSNDTEATYTLAYDGRGRLSMTVATSSKTWRSSAFYPEMKTWRTPMYLTFVGYVGWGAHCKHLFKEIRYLSAAPDRTYSGVLNDGFAVDSNAAATIAAGFTSSEMNCLDIPEVAFHGASALSLTANSGKWTFGIRGLSVAGRDNELVAASGVDLSISESGVVNYSGAEVASLELKGEVELPLTMRIRIPLAWRSAETAGTILGWPHGAKRIPTKVMVAWDDGEFTADESLVRLVANGIRFSRPGLIVVFR